ncbi:zinc ribbon domain-containing protein, partial [Psychrobacter sp. FME6]
MWQHTPLTRLWFCSSCQTAHQRDVNGAKNILAVGLGRL